MTTRRTVFASVTMLCLALVPAMAQSAGYVVYGHEVWNEPEHSVDRSLTIAPGGWLEIGTDGPGTKCEIHGALTVDPGGRIDIGSGSARVTTTVVRVHGAVELQGDAQEPSPDAGSVAPPTPTALVGEMNLTAATLEIVCRYQNEFWMTWSGGRLVSRSMAHIGGSMRDGTVYTTLFDLGDGAWDLERTVVQFNSAISVHDRGVLDATNIIEGDVPDAIHMNTGGHAAVRESTFQILFHLSFAKGGNAEGGDVHLNLRENERIPHWSAAEQLGIEDYVLTLDNCTVSTWWLAVVVASRSAASEAPPGRLTIEDCPSLGMHLEGENLRNDPLTLKDFWLPVTWTGARADGELKGEGPWIGPVPAGTEWDTGNLHWRVGDQPCDIPTWGVYPRGAETALVLPGPTNIAELIFEEGEVWVHGTEGKHDAVAPGLFYMVGDLEGTRRSVLHLENVMMGGFDESGRAFRGVFYAFDGGDLRIKNAWIGIATLRTEGSTEERTWGSITGEGGNCLIPIEPPPKDVPDYQEEEFGGPIRVDLCRCRPW